MFRAAVRRDCADLAILNTSGPDWTNRLKRLAARAPDPDIFSKKLVVRDKSGWQITAEGKAFLKFA